MSNTKQQIEEIPKELADGWRGWVHDQLDGTSFIADELKEIEEAEKRAVEAIDRLVTEAKQDVLKELVEWYEYALSVDDTSFDWYRAVKALMVSKDHKKPFSQLSNKENI